LAVCRGLVTLMGGQIGYRQTQGGGATFWFNIAAGAVAQVETG
jgi:signal transduction histidine kinase